MAGNWLISAETTTSGRPVLCSGKIESSLQPSVVLVNKDNPNLPILKSDNLILTTYRLLWLPNPESTTSSATASVPLADVTHIFQSKKSIKGMFASPRVRFQVSISSEGIVQEKGSKSTVITLVFRGKSDLDSFVGKLGEAWRRRAWEGAVSNPKDGDTSRVVIGSWALGDIEKRKRNMGEY